MEFIFPPPFGSEEDTPSYRLNSILTVSWTPAPNGTATSLTLWQLNSTTGNWFGDMEYITNNVIDRTNFRWIVATTKNLTVSDLFFLSIFEEGKTSADANSVPFTIVAAEDDDDQKGQQTETSTLATSTTASTSASTRTSAAVTTDPATTSISPEEDNASAGLATSAKIAIGVTIPLIALLLALAGFLFFKWRRKRKGISEQGAPQQQPYYPQDTAYKPNADLYQWQAHLAQGGQGGWGPSELPGSETGGLTRQYELESQPSQRP